MSMIWVPTWRCGNNCSYCDYGMKNDHTCIAFEKEIPANELPADRWIGYFGRYKANHLELTGGEPTVYADLSKVIGALPHTNTWAITTNLMHESIRNIPLDKCTCITASYHYKEDKKFFGNVSWLQKNGKAPRVTLVVTPENFSGLGEVMDRVLNSGAVGVNLHPVLKMGFEWPQELYQAIHALHRAPSINVVKDIPPKWEDGPQHKVCSLGDQRYLVIAPNGSIYRCYNEMMQNSPIACISDKTPQPRWRRCIAKCSFPCDQNAHDRYCRQRSG
jgi:organic radical activating enzyme